MANKFRSFTLMYEEQKTENTEHKPVEVRTNNSKKPANNRISTFLDPQVETKKPSKTVDNKSQLHQAIALGAFNLKKTVIENKRKEDTNNYLAREPNVLSILTLVSENMINDAENDDDDDDW